MEAERNRRKQILDTEAAVNVAEGHKRRVILESEANVCPSPFLPSQFKHHLLNSLPPRS